MNSFIRCLTGYFPTACYKLLDDLWATLIDGLQVTLSQLVATCLNTFWILNGNFSHTDMNCRAYIYIYIYIYTIYIYIIYIYIYIYIYIIYIYIYIYSILFDITQ